MLSKHDDGRRQVAENARDSTPSHDGGSMIDFLLMKRMSLPETKIGRGN
jgi:hypothetical protein